MAKTKGKAKSKDSNIIGTIKNSYGETVEIRKLLIGYVGDPIINELKERIKKLALQ